MKLNKQKLLTALIIFATLCSIGFSFSGSHVNWFWVGAPYLALILMAVAFLSTKAWLKLEQRKQDEKIQAILSSVSRKEADPTHNLSDREREVLGRIAEGKSNKQIADELFIELSTVKTHINKIYKTLNVSSRKEAAELAKK